MFLVSYDFLYIYGTGNTDKCLALKYTQQSVQLCILSFWISLVSIRGTQQGQATLAYPSDVKEWKFREANFHMDTRGKVI